jgi:arsenate reductase-like glutaredoxin family protein
LTLTILEEKGIDFQVIKYLDDTPSAQELKVLLGELDLDARSLMINYCTHT